MSTERPKTAAPENEIRVSGRTNVLAGVERVEEAFKKFDQVTISGINGGISTVLLITEIIKLKITGLHQYNLIETLTREAHEEDKEKEETEERPKYMTRFKVELHKNKLTTIPKGAFYEAPYTEEEIKKIKEVKPPEGKDRPGTGRPPRGFGRRGRGGPRGDRGGRGRGGPRGDRGGRGGPRGGRGDGPRGRGRGGPRGDRGGARGGSRGDRRGGDRGRGEARGKPRGQGRGGKKPEGETAGK